MDTRQNVPSFTLSERPSERVRRGLHWIDETTPESGDRWRKRLGELRRDGGLQVKFNMMRPKNGHVLLQTHLIPPNEASAIRKDRYEAWIEQYFDPRNNQATFRRIWEAYGFGQDWAMLHGFRPVPGQTWKELHAVWFSAVRILLHRPD